jgi:hypothetical protein
MVLSSETAEAGRGIGSYQINPLGRRGIIVKKKEMNRFVEKQAKQNQAYACKGIIKCQNASMCVVCAASSTNKSSNDGHVKWRLWDVSEAQGGPADCGGTHEPRRANPGAVSGAVT